MKRRRRMRRRRKVPEPVTILALISLAATLASTIIQLAVGGPTTTSEGPRLQDKQITTSTYGEAIPVGAGRTRLGTNIIWAPPISEVKNVNKSSGKGGGGGIVTTTYAYFGNFAAAIGQGPAAGLCRIWADNKVIYDNTAGNSTVWKYPEATLRFYSGTETQLPDPLIQQDKGVANTPAHRGLVYIVVGDLPLADFGNRLPQISIEVAFDSASLTSVTAITDATSPETLLTGHRDTPGKVVLNRGARQLLFVGQEPAKGAQLARIDLTTNLMLAAETGGPASLAYPSTDFVPATSGRGERGISIESMWWRPGGRVYLVGSAPRNAGGVDQMLVEVEPYTLEVLSFVNISGQTGISTLFLDDSTPFRSQAVCMSRDGYFGLMGAYNSTDAVAQAVQLQLMSHAGTAPLKQDPTATATVVSGSVSGLASTFWLCGWHEGALANPNGRAASIWKVIPPPAIFGGVGTMRVQHFDLANTLLGPNNLRIDCHRPTGMVFDDSTDTLTIFGDTDAAGKQQWVLFNTITNSVTGVVTIPVGSPAEQFVNAAQVQRSLQEGPTRGYVHLYQKTDDGFSRILLDAVDFVAGLSVGAGVTQTTLDDGTYYNAEPITMVEDLLENGDERVTRSAMFVPELNAIYRWGVGSPTTEVDFVALNKCSSSTVTLEDVVDRLMELGNLVKGTDYTLDGGFITATMAGYQIARQMDVRDAINPLSFSFLFDVRESDGKLEFLTRALNTVAVVIPQDDLGIVVNPSTGSGSRAVALLEPQIPDHELPERVDIRYKDIDRDHQEGNQHQRRQVTPDPTQFSRSSATLEVPISMNSDQAKFTAEANLYVTWLGRQTYKFSLGPKHLRLDGADVVQVENDSLTFEMRLIKGEIGQGFRYELEGARDAIETYTVDPLATFSGFTPATLVAGGATQLFVADIPYLRDQDSLGRAASGVYLAFGAYLSSWSGAVAQVSEDGGNTWITITAARSDAAWGYTRTAVAAVANDPDSAPGEENCLLTRWDRTSTITLTLIRGAVNFVSELESAVLNGANAMIIGEGSEAEVVQFANVTVVSADTVILDTILRGRRGTENRARVGHGIGTRVWLLDPLDVFQSSVGFASIGNTREFRAVSTGEVANNAYVTPVDFTGADLKPLSPVHVNADITPGSGRAATSIVVSWVRRTRLGGDIDFLDAITDVPVGEPAFTNGDLERYELVLLDAADSSESLSQTVTAESATLTAGQRTAAGYADTDPVNVAVYQISPDIGRGHVRTVIGI